MHYPVFEREGRWWFRDESDKEHGPFRDRGEAIMAYEEHLGFPDTENAA